MNGSSATWLLITVSIIAVAHVVVTADDIGAVFVVQYVGGVRAGFGGGYEGNEIVVPFLVSPDHSKEVSLLYDNCTTTVPEDIMTANGSPLGMSGGLQNYNVSVALNTTALNELKNGADSAFWKGVDSESNVLTFCVRVDITYDGDLVTGDEEEDGDSNKTSVYFEVVSLEVEIDFTAAVVNITGVEVEQQGPELVVVPGSVHGVTGCHCDASRNCYGVNNAAPALTIEDSLNVCFNSGIEGVSIIDVTFFTVTQGGLSFDTVAAGTDFYSESYEGNSAFFQSALPSAFFANVSSPLGATAILELSLSRRLLGGKSPASLLVPKSDLGGNWELRRTLQESSEARDALVEIEIDSVMLFLGEDPPEEMDHPDDDFVSGSLLILVVGVAVVAAGLVVASVFVARRRAAASKHLSKYSRPNTGMKASVEVDQFKNERI